MPRDDIPEGRLDEVAQHMYEVCDDTGYTQQASVDGWRYLSRLAADRANTIEKEMED